MLVPAGSPIFFLREHRFSLVSQLLGSVFIDVVYAITIIVEVVFIIGIYIFYNNYLLPQKGKR